MERLVAMAASATCAAAVMISALAAPPTAAAAGVVADVETSEAAILQPAFAATVGDRVFFKHDRFTLTRQARATLARQAAWLSTRGQLAVVIAGHCDSHEARDDRVDLAARRSDAVFGYLSAKGLAYLRIRKVSYGADRPVDAGTSQTALARNRSAQIILINVSSR